MYWKPALTLLAATGILVSLTACGEDDTARTGRDGEEGTNVSSTTQAAFTTEDDEVDDANDDASAGDTEADTEADDATDEPTTATLLIVNESEYLGFDRVYLEECGGNLIYSQSFEASLLPGEDWSLSSVPTDICFVVEVYDTWSGNGMYWTGRRYDAGENTLRIVD